MYVCTITHTHMHTQTQDELEDKTSLQEALIKSEELRLALANTLVSTQVQSNAVCVGLATTKC